MDTLFQDLRYAIRTLGRSPAFALTAVATLALGIGANTSLFSVLNGVLLRPPAAVAAPEGLVALYRSDPAGQPYGVLSYPDVRDLASLDEVFAGVAGYAPRPLAVQVREETRVHSGEVVSADYFGVLGAAPALGRAFVAEEDAPGAAPVAVVSHRFWKGHLGGDAAVLGRPLVVNGGTFTVVGVAPEGFAGSMTGVAADVWLTVHGYDALSAEGGVVARRGTGWLNAVARLRPGVDPAAVGPRLDALAGRLAAAHPAEWTGREGAELRIASLPYLQTRIAPGPRGFVVTLLGMLLGVTGLVLLICCANLANLLLARAAGRTREIAVRLALGAGRRRLVRQLLTESVLLSLAGGAAGALVAGWTTGLLMAFRPPAPVEIELDLAPDARVLAFTVALALVTGLVFGLAPALRATRPDLVPALKEGREPARRGRRVSLQGSLVVAQVALSLVLLVTAGLLVRSLANARGADVGFRPEHVAVVSAAPTVQGYSPERAREFYRALEERIAALPGVEAVSLARTLPLGMSDERTTFSLPGRTFGPGEDDGAGVNRVGPAYFDAMGIPLVAGRAFAAADRDGAPPAAIVNETFARRHFPDGALGRTLSTDGGRTWARIVGVARDAKYASVAEQPQPYLYLAAAQGRPTESAVVVRVSGDPVAALAGLRAAAREVDPAVPARTTTLEQETATSLLPQRLASTLLGIFGALGLGLAAVGLYGTMAYAVGRRTREIGIRMALGAGGGEVVALVVRRGMALAGAGLAIGLVASLGAGRLVAGLLYGVSPSDPATFGAIALLLSLVALVASGLPALRAARLDPVTALRSD